MDKRLLSSASAKRRISEISTTGGHRDMQNAMEDGQNVKNHSVRIYQNHNQYLR